MQPLLHYECNKYYIFWVCVCSLIYPACNAHAPYCRLWPVPLQGIFPHYLMPIYPTFIGAYAKLRKAEYWLRHVCPSFRTSVHGKTLLPLVGFSWKWYLSIFLKSVEKIQVSLKSDNNNRYITWRPIYSILLRKRNVADKSFRRNQNTYFIFRNFFFSKMVPKRHDFRNK